MAWRPNRYLTAGELDNTTPGRVTGWLEFVGHTGRVVLDLNGDFHRDVRGAVLRIARAPSEDNARHAAAYFNGFAIRHTGVVGDITAGRPPRDYVDYPYIEWYSVENGRVVLELEPKEIEVVGTPLDWHDQAPISREIQREHLQRFLASASRELASQFGAAK